MLVFTNSSLQQRNKTTWRLSRVGSEIGWLSKSFFHLEIFLNKKEESCCMFINNISMQRRKRGCRAFVDREVGNEGKTAKSHSSVTSGLQNFHLFQGHRLYPQTFQDNFNSLPNIPLNPKICCFVTGAEPASKNKMKLL